MKIAKQVFVVVVLLATSIMVLVDQGLWSQGKDTLIAPRWWVVISGAILSLPLFSILDHYASFDDELGCLQALSPKMQAYSVIVQISTACNAVHQDSHASFYGPWSRIS
jgi:hypothetical protein